MGLNTLDRSIERLGLFSALGYIFFSVVPYAIAGKHICTGLMLVAFVTLLLRKSIRNIPYGWLPLSLYLVLGLALLSALLSPDALGGLNQMRKDGLPFMLAFLLLASQPEEEDGLQRTRVMAIWALILGYAVKEILAVRDGVANNFVFSIYETTNGQLPKFLDFFATDTIFYLPILLSVLLFWPINFWQRVLLLIVSVTALMIVTMAGVRTTFVTMAMLVVAFMLVRSWPRKLVTLVVILIVLTSAFVVKDYVTNPSIARYYTVFSEGTYQFGRDGSVSERKAIIKAVWEISKERLWIGYGPGWKKLPVIAHEGGHMERWQASTDPIDELAYRYFSYGEGRVNPHNLYMQLLFEVGAFGLLAYAAFLVSLMFSGFKHWIRGGNVRVRAVGMATVFYVGVYAVTGMAGGVWLPVSLLVLMLWSLDVPSLSSAQSPTDR